MNENGGRVYPYGIPILTLIETKTVHFVPLSQGYTLYILHALEKKNTFLKLINNC